jgi:hypothetical protein
MSLSRERATESNAKDLVRRVLRLYSDRISLTVMVVTEQKPVLRIGRDADRQTVLRARTALEHEAMDVTNSYL